MHPRETVDLVLRLSSLGLIDSENAFIVGVSIHTIRHWRQGKRRAGRRPKHTAARKLTCPLCHSRVLDKQAYAHLLGLYLGDGHLTAGTKGTYLLWLFCGNDWPGLIEEAERAAKAVMPTSTVFRTARGKGCMAVKSCAKHWPCLFPQHGPGMKHTRRIELEAWQQEIVDECPGLFVRGLFHSDGCRVTNRIVKLVAGREKEYEYPRYFFSNQSIDILRLCGDALDRLGIARRYSRRNAISVARREAVATLDEFVGPKY